MMGRRCGDQASLFYEFRIDERVPQNHLLRRINGFVTAVLADMHERLEPMPGGNAKLARSSTGRATFDWRRETGPGRSPPTRKAWRSFASSSPPIPAMLSGNAT
jgi:hypothetical protein